MNYGPLVFLAAFFGLAASWFGLVMTPQIQLGRGQPETNIVSKSDLYPLSRPGVARQGLEVYRANGCAACHSQQISQTGIEINLLLVDIGTNPVAVVKALVAANVGVASATPPSLAAGLPKTVARNLNVETAKAAVKALNSAGAKASVDLVLLGPDIARGWGQRRTVAADFLADDTVLLGSLRAGPDLANVGSRLPDVNWQLKHLYAPRAVVPDSTMPSYRYLFERRKINRQPSLDALPKEIAPTEPGFEIVPTPEARALAAYLVSLRANVQLFETPMSLPPAPAAASTNSPAK